MRQDLRAQPVQAMDGVHLVGFLRDQFLSLELLMQLSAELHVGGDMDGMGCRQEEARWW
ncbi:MAG: hypothetical protein ACLQUY_17050 [Ktedonobacterales bacterium]